MQIRTTTTDLIRLSEWVRKRYTGLRTQRKIAYASLSSLVYNIWKNRNLAVWEGKCGNPKVVMKNSVEEVKKRILHLIPKKITR